MSADQLSFRQAVEADVPFLLLLRERTMVTHQLASGVPPSADERERRVAAKYPKRSVSISVGEPRQFQR